MRRCLISYQPLEDTHGNYHPDSLKRLARGLDDIKPLTLTAEQLRQEAVQRATKMSIQGVQPKLSAKLRITEQYFDIVDRGGQFIIKPQSHLWPELPENEDLTMHLASMVGLEVPLHGLALCEDGSRAYFIKRFDRAPGQKKFALEDFAQLMGLDRETKYSASMENVIKVIQQFATFPHLEHLKLFKIILLSFLTGNEDMHLKNFSLIRRNQKVELSPSYDLLNTTIAIQDPTEQLALTLNGKKNKITRDDLLEYFAKSRLKLSPPIIERTLSEFQAIIPTWHEWVKLSFLSAKMKEKYAELLELRCEVIWPK